MVKSIDSLPILFPEFTSIKNGQRLRAPKPFGSLEALSLAQLAGISRQRGRLLTVITADAADALRLTEEIPWFDPKLKVMNFPDWEILPYDTLSPHSELVSERLSALYRLLNRDSRENKPDVLLISAATAGQKLPPKSFIGRNAFFFKKGETVDPAQIREHLVAAGYDNVSQVVAPGEFSSRGSLLDIYPMGTDSPYRLDFFDNEIDQIRLFDPDTQRSLESVKQMLVLPGHEFPMDEESRKYFLSRWRETFSGDPTKVPLYKDLENGIAAAGIENYLPLFFDHTDTIFDYIEEKADFVLTGEIEEALLRFNNDAKERSKFLSSDPERPILPLEDLYIPAEELFTHLKSYPRLIFTAPEQSASPIPPVFVERTKTDPVEHLRSYSKAVLSEGSGLLIAVPSPGRLERLTDYFHEHSLSVTPQENFETFLNSAPDGIRIAVAPLTEGAFSPELKLAILTETELYADSAKNRRKSTRRKERASNIEMMIRDLSELKIGDPVVHIEHGIGRYCGLTTLRTDQGDAEFFQLEYAKNAKLYIPVDQLHLISRYSGADPENAPLHTLGKGDWEKTRQKVAKIVRDTAAELLNLYAIRKSRSGYSFQFSESDYERFCESFPFEETEDQQQAIHAVLKDMRSKKSMDRLICGDVGFGKTEVALRAAFAAVMAGKQVAILCPTTLLAEQHTKTFQDRFAAWPVKIGELSRFRNSKETQACIEGIKNGSVDIVVGTHKLLTSSVEFSNLGLVIIDEEHRFGVRQKEKLKSLRAEVDVLTLTATPIPRTLAMSLEGIRDFSVIATAPQKRLAIKTFVRRESDSVIREAVLRELKRGGQVYFLHNEVETIENRRERLQKLLPEARIGVAHGQMNEKELELVMRDFYSQRTNVLLCTTIIETGIDIPNANTIIMHRADKFGLAQLHQLRGRVGRSHHQAYAYLLTPGKENITKNAQKRLEAIQEMEELGSGFYLAMHDLEIRGAGEVLGEHQSGSMTEVGFDLYTQMLEDAIAALKNGKEPNPEATFSSVVEINLHASALFRADYIADVGQRLSLYKRLAAAGTIDELNDIKEEVIDRFGNLPEEAKNLLLTHRLRIRAKKAGVTRVDLAKDCIRIAFSENPNINVNKVFLLLQKRKNLRMIAQNKLQLTINAENPQQRIEAVEQILGEIACE
jgi:transcription-repair coupling factor (superfamily II helicase)